MVDRLNLIRLMKAAFQKKNEVDSTKLKLKTGSI